MGNAEYMGSYSSIMRAAILLAVVAVATGAPKFSKQAISTPLSRGGGRIVGGTEASPGEFPHQIALLRGGVGGSLMCGGSLVAPNMVVTAGHGVSKVMLHEDYDSWTIYNDICLLELSGEADFGSSVIGAISLPSDGKEYSAGTMCTVSGWGTTSEGGSLGSTLMKVTVPVVSDDDCRAAYGQSDVADSMICAGLDEGGKDSCQETLVDLSCVDLSCLESS